uniref:ADAM metallopeptidase with thrombospondin type 1 motif 7 n=1 Tax=Sinocyclocheilus grahami TaxID=75366 RepID=A0A672L8V5_SINGR
MILPFRISAAPCGAQWAQPATRGWMALWTGPSAVRARQARLSPESVNGGWDSWSEWSECTRTCGVGVQNAQRDCYGGKYCLGERRRYQTCNRDPCPADHSFRHIQCSRFNTLPYKGKFYKWIHVNNRGAHNSTTCATHHFSERMLDTVVDGTQCYEGSQSRDICINGICKVGNGFDLFVLPQLPVCLNHLQSVLIMLF